MDREAEADAGPGKRVKLGEVESGDGLRTAQELAEKEENETEFPGSEEMQINVSQIYEKIEHYTQMMSEILESGKSMFQELINDFEERLIMMHKEQLEKWQEEIKELRMLDALNEEAFAVLHNARCLFQNPDVDSSAN